jgi:hypothetical protein
VVGLLVYININIFPMFHYIVLNIVYIYVCARFVDIIICVLLTLLKIIQFSFILISSFQKGNVSIFLWVSQSYSGLFIQNKLSTLDMNFPTSEKTINIFPMFHYIVLNIVYIYVCARFVDIIICVLLVGRGQSISCDNFLSNPVGFSVLFWFVHTK